MLLIHWSHSEWRGWGLGHGFSRNFAANRQEKRPTHPFTQNPKTENVCQPLAKELNSASCGQVWGKNIQWANELDDSEKTKVLLSGLFFSTALAIFCFVGFFSTPMLPPKVGFPKRLPRNDKKNWGFAGMLALTLPLSRVPGRFWYWNDSCRSQRSRGKITRLWLGWDRFKWIILKCMKCARK